jgi:uncharacterized repeat protein (TIGR03803 family)
MLTRIRAVHLVSLGTFLVLLSSGMPASAGGRQVLHNHVPAAAANSQPVGHLPSSKRLNLTLGLPLRNQEALSNLLVQLYDPASPNYRHYLTAAQFAEQFGPTEADYQKLIKFAKTNGLVVIGTHANRTLLDVRGSVTDVERVCHVTLRLYPHPKESRTFYAPDVEPSVDLDLPLLSIGGLNNYIIPHPMNLRAASAGKGPNAKPAGTGSASDGGFIGNDFRAAYVPGVSLTGIGQTVGLLEFDSGFYTNDITAYKNLSGLPDVPVLAVLLDGYSGAAGSANDEVSLDIEMAISLAPGLSQVLVYEGDTTDDILNRMATDNIAKQLSASWTYPIDANSDQIFLQYAAQGQSFFNASGDSDAYAGPVPPPTDDPNITIVGGTTLTTTGPGGAWASETVWNWGSGTGGGGGVSTGISIPPWQQGIDMSGNGGSTGFRNLPDVALTADNIWVNYGDGLSGSFGGTSCATPLWAAYTALANQLAVENNVATLGFINPAVYAIGKGPGYGADFHDIATGNNTWSGSPNEFYAVPGYDLCTGWGTPTGNSLLYDLALPEPLRIFPAAVTVSSGPVGGPFTPISQTYTLTNGSTAAFNWLLVNSNAWLDVSLTNGTLEPSGPATSVNAAINASANAFAPGSYMATLWFTNLNDNFGQSREFILDVVTPPVITSQPSDQAVIAGTPAAFSIQTSSNALQFYQWQLGGINLHDNANISGATNSALSIKVVEGANVGNYSVIVSNAAGVAVSSNAALSIIPSLPIITSQPTNVSALPGGPASFRVSVIGNQPFTFQWRLGSNNLGNSGSFSGANTATLSISNISSTLAGIYSVVISNSLGSVTSTDAVLTVATLTASNVTYTVPHLFSGGTPGEYPYGGLVQAKDGNIYGTAFLGGADGDGLTFKMTSGNAVTVLHSFTGGADGAIPAAGMIQASDGNLYGTTEVGGSVGYGNVFKMTTSGALTGLFQFNDTKGSSPIAPVLQGSDGNLYGTTYTGGTYENGTVFKMTTAGSLTTLASFNGTNNGASPYSGLVEGTDGNYYGTTPGGGIYGGLGTVFKITSTGTLTTLHSFSGNDGAFPYAGLVLASDGYFYGATFSGFTNGYGAIFRMTAAGALTNIYFFTGSNDGGFPAASLIQATDGNLYGTTYEGGINGNGTIFQITTNGVFTTLAQFDGYNGSTPQAPLIQASDETFYGTTGAGGIGYDGTPGSGDGLIFQFSVPFPPRIIAQTTNQIIAVGANTFFSAAVIGSVPLTYQWQFNGASLTDGNGIAGSLTSSLSVSDAQLTNSGSYQLIVTNAYGSATSSVVTLSVDLAPAITNQPQSQAVVAGMDAMFSVGASGTGPLLYQWQFNGTNLASATDSRYTVSAAQASNAGNYSVVVSNAVGSITSSNAALTVASPPVITNQPKNLNVVLGNGSILVVGVIGTAPLSFQWVDGGTNVPGATNRTLVFSNIKTNQAGNYWLVITNAYGAITSSVAVVTVLTVPAITGQPQNQSVTIGSNATFTVGATGGNLGYQWRFNSGPISGATGSTYTVLNAQTNNAGNYSVVVTNSLGSATSSNAVLTVSPPQPPQFQSVTVLSNGTVQMVLAGQSGSTYAIDGSPDLVTWNPLVTFVVTSGTYQFTDMSATNNARGFYRGRLVP